MLGDGSCGDGPSGDGPHVFVADVDHPDLTDDDRHHLEKVLRVRPGDRVSVSDGRGAWRACRFGDPLEPAGDVVRVPAPHPRLGVGFALLKQGRAELVVQKLTEIGVDDIRPFAAERSVVRWDESKRVAQVERWRRVAREAAMQSRRVWLPDVHEIGDLPAIAGKAGTALAERGGERPSSVVTTLVTGPEGGFSEAERTMAQSVTLGPHVLRAETAAIVAGTVLVALRSGVVRATQP